MFFILREVMGWILILTALVVLWIGLSYVTDPAEPRVVEAAVFVFAAGSLLRVGTLLVRISTAVRICTSEKRE